MAKKATVKRPVKRVVGQTTATKRVKAAAAAASKPQARIDMLDRRIAEAADPAAERRPFEALKRPSWARFEAFATDDGAEAELDVYDVIGTWELNADTFRRALGQIKANRITVNINSPGGNVLDAFAMYQDLKDHPAHVHIRVRGVAASAASLLAMAGDSIEIAENAFVMIHNSWNYVLGDRREMAKAGAMLTKIDKRLAATYAGAAERRDVDTDAAAFAELMDAETWFDAEQAVDAGLADSVGPEAPKAEFSGLDVSRFAKTPDVVKRASKARAPALVQAQAAPALDTPQVSAAFARLLENITR
jgi:ATP-dependent Clp protease protease subunit